MTLEKLIISLQEHIISVPEDREATEKTIEWIKKHRDFAFVKTNLEGHITASLFITNPNHTKILLMYHKKHQIWCQFGGHCDGESDTLSVARREFHEESGVIDEPTIGEPIFAIQVWDISARTSSSGMYQPAHKHFDISYLGVISEEARISRQEDEVDDIRWIDIDGTSELIEDSALLSMVEKIRHFG